MKRPLDEVPMFGADRFEAVVALRRAGLVFEHGRPLPGEVVPLDEAVARVMAALESRQPPGRPMPAASSIERVVRRRYLDVTPWPFGALVD